MIGEGYQNKKAIVRDLVARYLQFSSEVDDGVDREFLKKRDEHLNDGRFMLAVVGETKAGKSTFINALLGEQILPTDILQSSSAIVEIFKSNKKYVKVIYADGHVEKVPVSCVSWKWTSDLSI